MILLADLEVNWVVILRVGIVFMVVALPCAVLLWSKPFSRLEARLQARVWQALSWARLPDQLKRALTTLVFLPIVALQLLTGFLAALGILMVALATGGGYPPADMLHPLFTLPITIPSPNRAILDAFGVTALGVLTVSLAAFLLMLFDITVRNVRILGGVARPASQAAVMGAASALAFGALALLVGRTACPLVGCSVSLSRDPSGYVPLFATYGAIYGAQLGYFAAPPTTKPAVFEVKAALRQFAGALIFGVAYDFVFVAGGRLDTALELAALTSAVFSVVGGFLPTISWLAQDDTNGTSRLALFLGAASYLGIAFGLTVMIFVAPS